jgi:hypothetical protein
MTKKEQFIQIELHEEPLEGIVPLNDTDELCEFFRIWTTNELDLL